MTSYRARKLNFERLERREVFSADLDAVRVDALVDYAAKGQSLAIETSIANRSSSDASLDYVVEFRLSLDRTLDSSDLLLGSVTRPGLAVSSLDKWTQQLTIPATALHARYFVTAAVRNSADVLEDTAIDDQSTSVVFSSLTGVVSYQGRSSSVFIRSYLGESTPILDSVPTWLVIHGRNSSPSSPNLVQLGTALDGVQPGDQVLVLDWSGAAASGSLGGAGENFIKPVATWGASALSVYGFTGGQLNIVGHSWGAYVGVELAERLPAPRGKPGQANSIIAIDPATDFPGGSYNPLARGEVNFARNSKFSWAFYATGGAFGSSVTASTAHESFVVTSTDHSKLVNVVAELVTLAALPTASPASLGGQFVFDRLLVSHSPNPAWRANSYQSSGRRINTGTFEAVVRATPDGLGVKSLTFVAGLQEVTYLP